MNELHGALTYFHSIGQIGSPNPSPAPADPEPTSEAETPTADNEEKSPPVDATPVAEKAEKPARKPRAKKETAADVAAGELNETKAESKQKPLVEVTAADAAAAITEVANRKGLAAAKALLTVFNVKRAGDLDASQYESFIKEATDLLKPEEEAEVDEDPADIL